jgi:hypothetical protein
MAQFCNGTKEILKAADGHFCFGLNGKAFYFLNSSISELRPEGVETKGINYNAKGLEGKRSPGYET